MKTIAQLSHEVGALLRAECSEKTRFASMDLAQDIMAVHDTTRDQFMQETLRSWVGKLQDKYQR